MSKARIKVSVIFLVIFIFSINLNLSLQNSNLVVDQFEINDAHDSIETGIKSYFPSTSFDSESYYTYLESGDHLYINISEYPTENNYMFHIHTNTSTNKVDVYILTFENYLKFNNSNSDYEMEYNYTDIHELTLKFSLNQTKQWALVILNKNSTQTARFSYFLENDRPLLPIFDESSHDYVKNAIILEGKMNYSISINFRKGQTLKLGFKTFFPAEKFQYVYILNQYNYEKYQKSEDFQAEVTIENYGYYRMPIYKIPESGVYYIVFDNSGSERTMVFSCYYDVGIYYGEDGKLSFADLSNFSSIFVNFNLLGLFLIASLMLIAIIAIIIYSNKETNGNKQNNRKAEDLQAKN